MSESSTHRTIPTILLTIALLLSLTGCSSFHRVETCPSDGSASCPADPEILPTEEEPGTPDASEPTPALAAFDTVDGGEIAFYDVGDGYAGVVETSAVDRPYLASGLIVEASATPLEIFSALAPADQTAPPILVRDHQASTDGRAPKALSLSVPRSLFERSDREAYRCGIAWRGDWRRAYRHLPGKDAAYRFSEAQPRYQVFYPGGNANGQTYLGVCSKKRFHTGGYWLDMMDFEVERRDGNRWVTVLRRKVYGGTKVTFYSARPSAR
ncbi:MAG: hypothetical protein AAGE94_06420, partial [Acidobacteriota bacterium]